MLWRLGGAALTAAAIAAAALYMWTLPPALDGAIAVAAAAAWTIWLERQDS